jgi:hypothetical protein
VSTRAGRLARRFLLKKSPIGAALLFACPAFAQLGAISGTITNGVTPLAGVLVDVHPTADGGTPGFATTNGSGSFTVTGLATDSYRIRFKMSGVATEWYDNQRSHPAATLVVVNAPATTTLNTVVLSSSAGGISGLVSLAGGAPVPAGVSVDVYEQSGFRTDYVDSFPVTAGTGAYNTGFSLRPFDTYVARVQGFPSGAGGFGTQWSGGALSGPAAATIAVTASTTATSVNFTLPLGGGIKGTITCAVAMPPLCASAGDPVEGARVNVEDFATGSFVINSVVTDANGDYERAAS